MSTDPNRTGRRGFTLIEILIVVVILGILAAIVIPQFSSASQDANDAAVRDQLRTIRLQIEYYRAQVRQDPTFLVDQWNDLVSNDFLQQAPRNPLNGSMLVAAAPAAGVGWVWRDQGNGTFEMYATDGTATAELVE